MIKLQRVFSSTLACRQQKNLTAHVRHSLRIDQEIQTEWPNQL
jgi:hypothetical protein